MLYEEEIRFVTAEDSDGVTVVDLTTEDPQGAAAWMPCAGSKDELVLLLKKALNDLTDCSAYN